jgi:hypothetical protein
LKSPHPLQHRSSQPLALTQFGSGLLPTIIKSDSISVVLVAASAILPRYPPPRIPPVLSVPVGMSLVSVAGEPSQAVAHSIATKQAASPGRNKSRDLTQRSRGRLRAGIDCRSRVGQLPRVVERRSHLYGERDQPNR